jgi:hypothetical protein
MANRSKQPVDWEGPDRAGLIKGRFQSPFVCLFNGVENWPLIWPVSGHKRITLDAQSSYLTIL